MDVHFNDELDVSVLWLKSDTCRVYHGSHSNSAGNGISFPMTLNPEDKMYEKKRMVGWIS